jgi:hypothetical protein
VLFTSLCFLGVPMRKNHHSAFTLIEVLSVSAIFLFLTGLLVHTVNKVQVTADQTASLKPLKSALDSWKKGQRPANLAGGPSGVTMQDSDWEASHPLLAYQIGDCTEEGAYLRCSVQLRLRGPHNRPVVKWVTYRVLPGTPTNVTREELP